MATINIIGRADPNPTDLILAYGGLDGVDSFEASDRLAVVDRLENVGRNFSINWGLGLFILTVFISAVGWVINFIMGYETDLDDVLFCCFLIPFMGGINAYLGIKWIIGAYREAVQVVANE